MGINHARSGENENLGPGFECIFQLTQIQTCIFGCGKIVQPYGHDLGAEKLNQFPVGKIVGLHDSDLVPGRNT